MRNAQAHFRLDPLVSDPGLADQSRPGRHAERTSPTPNVSRQINHTAPGRLATFLESVTTQPVFWRKDELKAILRYHLAAPIQFSLANFRPGLSKSVKGPQQPPILLALNLNELFQQPNPPLELLQLVKHFAKSNFRQLTSAWPAEITHLIYFLTIAVAFVRCAACITRLKLSEIRSGFKWALTRPWVTADIRELVRSGLRVVGTNANLRTTQMFAA